MIEKKTNEKSRKLEISINSLTGTTLASSTDTDTGIEVIDEISHNIANIVRNVFSNYGQDIVDVIEKALLQSNFDEAYTLLVEGRGKGILHLGSKESLTRLFRLVQQFSLPDLSPEKRKEIFEIKFFLSEPTGIYSDLFNDVDSYINEYGNETSSKLQRSLLLLKANAASQQGKKELAYNLYVQVLKDADGDYANSAWAHRGLAITLGYDNPDGLYHESMAADEFLLAGNKTMYAGSKAVLSEYIKVNNPQNALELLDDAICVFDSDNMSQRESIAALHLNKALIYNMLSDNASALKEAELSFELRDVKGEFGNEAGKIAALNAAIEFEKALLPDNAQRPFNDIYAEKIKSFEKSMMDTEKEDYFLRQKLAEALSEKNFIALKEIEQKILKSNDAEFIALYWIALILLSNDVNSVKKFELLEMAWTAANLPNVRNDVKASVCSLFAETYMEQDMDEKALEWYKKALELNPFIWTSRQNYAALLWKNNKWGESVVFFAEQRKLFGDLPSILYGYGRSLLEAGHAEKARTVLWEVKKIDSTNKYIDEYLNRAMEGSPGFVPGSNTSHAMILDSVTIESLEQCLIDFCQFIKTDKRMTFWKFNNAERRHTWIISPEHHGQTLLHTFIKSRFGNNVEVMEEVSTGAGRIDIYLRFQNGLKTIVELKMCGNGYSGGYALDGLEQLTHYLENKQTHLGYLLIFDARKRDLGKGINSQYLRGNYTIRSYIADVRPTVKVKD